MTSTSSRAQHVVGVERDRAGDLARRHLLEPRSAPFCFPQQGTKPATVVSSGPGAITRPSSSATTASSGNPSPMPPCSSGDRERLPVEADEGVPQLAARVGWAARDRTASTWARTIAVGHSFASTARTESRSSSWSAVKSSCISPRRPGRASASARRSSFSIAVSGSASVTTTASGNLYPARWSAANERSSSGVGGSAPSREHDHRDADLTHDVVGPRAPPPHRRWPDGWRAPLRPPSDRRCSRRARTSPSPGPARRRRPASSIQPRSPVRTKPSSVNASAVSSGARQ